MAKNNTCDLRFLIFGTGAIGTYIGGSLLASGQDVVFLERPEVVSKIKDNGLKLKANKTSYYFKHARIVTSVDEALTFGPYDVAIVAVKSYDTESLIHGLYPYRAAIPPILCLQNGVENEQKLMDAFGENKVIAGTLTSAVGKIDAGSVVLEKLRGIGIGDSHLLVSSLVSVFNNAGLKAKSYDNTLGMKWSKMITNLLANATSAILDLTPAEIFSDRRLCQIEIRQIREIVKVMEKMKIPVVDLPGTPVRLLTWGIKYLPLMIAQPFLQFGVGKGRGGKMPSFHIDLHSGRGRSEVDYLNGAVVRFGEKNRVKTPVNQALNETLLCITSGQIDPDQFRHQPEKLVALIPE